ncbi:MAG: ABC transporter ATP-binding protein [Bacteroidetes bacterium]|nr:ABC transporter ATP-binding protein [Bacteroidota bacterium]
MKALFYLNKFILKYKFKMFWGIVFIALSNWLSIYPAQIFRNVIDVVMESVDLLNNFKNTKFDEAIKDLFITSALWFGVGLFIFAIARGVFVFFMRQTIIMVSRYIEYDLKNEIYNKYQQLDISFYKNNNTGDIMNRISEDVTNVRMYLGPAIMYTINLIILFVLVIFTMVNINLELSIYVLLPLPVLTILIYFVSRRMTRLSGDVQGQLSKIYNKTQETFAGVRVVKAYTKEKQSVEQFNAEAKLYKEKALKLALADSMFSPLIFILPVLSTVITVFIGGMEVINGNISYGNIAEFVIYINLLTWPVASLGWVTSLTQKAIASQRRINQFLQTPSKIVNPTNDPFAVKGEVEFKNVSFTYPESGIKALINVSFKIPLQTSLAIIGKTGSGKTTIALLINRMYDPDAGEIFIDDVNIKNINLNELRKQTGMVPQEVFLFSDTIEGNIAFGSFSGGELSDQERELVVEAAKKAAIHDNICSFPSAYKTIIGERGITLSGGQKQRLSIARALLKSPKILVLDDCLSAVDTETEEAILNSLKSETQGKTALIISHRVSSIKNCNQIIVLNQGTIIEQGNHEQLMESKGLYYELYQTQLLEEGKS